MTKAVPMTQVPRYPKEATDQQLWKLLQRKVRDAISPEATAHAKARASSLSNTILVGYILLIGVYLMLSGLGAQEAQLVLAALLGFTALPLLLNVGHEGVHGNLEGKTSGRNRANFVFTLLGTSSYFWGLRHLSSHHVMPNVIGYDLDIEQAKIIRLGEGQPYKAFHKYQHLYMPIAFLFYTLLWFFVRDFKDIGRRQFGVKEVNPPPTRVLVYFFLAKVWHLTFLILLPILFGASPGYAVLCFFVFHLSASAATTFVLVSTHVGEDQDVVSPNESGYLPSTWLAHTLKTTADFSTGSTFALQFFGGFNHHVAHHLFPNIPHLLYPKVTRAIVEHCSENELEYVAHTNVIRCALSHLKRLHHLSMDF